MPPPSGQLTDMWRGYCAATFTSDVPIKDGFGDVVFTARTGEEYLLTAFDTLGGQPRVEIAYLTRTGPDTFTVPVNGAPEAFPFTSNCTLGNTVEYYAAFTDVPVYETENLGTRLCVIPAGTSMLRDTSTNSGYSIVGVQLSGPQTYDLVLNVFSSLCGNAEHGYISVPEIQVLNGNTWVVPVAVVLKAK